MVLFPTIDFAPTIREFRDIVVTLALWRSRVKNEKVVRRKAVYEALSKHPALEQMALKLPGATRWEKLDYYSRGGAQRKEKHFRQAAFYGQTGARARVMMLYCWIVASLLPPEADISNLVTHAIHSGLPADAKESGAYMPIVKDLVTMFKTPLPDFVNAKVADECPNYASVDWDAFITEAEGRFGDNLVKFDVQDSPSMLLNPDLQPGQIIVPVDGSSYRLMIWCVKALELGHPITGDGTPVLSAHFNVYLPSDWKASKPKPKRTLSLPAPEPTLLIMPDMQHAETFSGRPTSPPPAYTSTRPTSMHLRQGTMNSIKSVTSAASKLSEKAEKLGPLASKFSDQVEKLGPLANKWSEKAGPLAGKFSEKASGWLHAAGKAIPAGDLTAAIVDTVADGVGINSVTAAAAGSLLSGAKHPPAAGPAPAPGTVAAPAAAPGAAPAPAPVVAPAPGAASSPNGSGMPVTQVAAPAAPGPGMPAAPAPGVAAPVAVPAAAAPGVAPGPPPAGAAAGPRPPQPNGFDALADVLLTGVAGTALFSAFSGPTIPDATAPAAPPAAAPSSEPATTDAAPKTLEAEPAAADADDTTQQTEQAQTSASDPSSFLSSMLPSSAQDMFGQTDFSADQGILADAGVWD